MKKPRFLVRSPAKGLQVIKHPEITRNFEAALRWKPKHRKAVLVPCAGTKPFPDSPSHAHGYLPALEGKQADLWVVSEPLGVVPYEWSRREPQTSYDFPPQFLRGKAHAVLAARIARWFKQVGTKYDTVVLALPGHHMRLVDTALGLLEREPTRIVRAGIGECLDDGACPKGHYRATTSSYRGFLKARANPGGSSGGLPLIKKKAVWHVGSRAAGGTRPHSSYEGFGVSVSDHPAEWARIARLSGETWKLTPASPRANGSFLDVLRIPKAAAIRLTAAAVAEGLLVNATYWKAWSEDNESGEQRFTLHASQREAAEEAEHLESERPPEAVRVWVATPQLLALWAQRFSGSLGPELAEEVAWQVILERDRPDLDGFWWDETLDPAGLSAPRGMIFYSRVPRWEWVARKARANPPGRDWLILVHPGSLDSYAMSMASDPQARGLAEAMASEARDTTGPVIVVDNPDVGGGVYAFFRRELKAARPDAEIMPFDEAVQEWDVFLPQLVKKIKAKGKPRSINVGGIWWQDDLEDGCASTVYKHLLGAFGKKVMKEPDRSILGSHEDEEDDADYEGWGSTHNPGGLQVFHAEPYVSPRHRQLTPREEHVRAVAYALKVPDPAAVHEAALAMASLVPPGAALVPIPSSAGSLTANAALAGALAGLTGGYVAPILRRASPVEASHQRRRRGEHGLLPEAHAASFAATGPVPPGPVVLVDNVVTSGATLEGAWRVLGSPARMIGVAYARASEVTAVQPNAPKPSPTDWNVWITWVLYAVTGNLAAADSIMVQHGDSVRRVAKALSKLMPVPQRTLWRGLLLEAHEVVDGYVQPRVEHQFLSFSEDRDVACWFADRQSVMSGVVAQLRPQTTGWLTELKPPHKDVLFHWSWAPRFPVAGQVGPLWALARMHPDLSRVADQTEKAMRGQKEVILDSRGAKALKVVPHESAGCPPTAALDQRFTWRGALRNPPVWLGKLASWTAVGAASEFLLGPIQRAVSGETQQLVTRMNPDEDMRRLERLAAQGDLQAMERLRRAQDRTRWLCEECGTPVLHPALGLLDEDAPETICAECEQSNVRSGLDHGMIWLCPKCGKVSLQDEDTCESQECVGVKPGLWRCPCGAIHSDSTPGCEDCGPEANPPAGLRIKILDRGQDGFHVRAYVGRKAVGHVSAVQTLRHYEVTSAQVDEALHRQGIGAALYAVASDEACRRGKTLFSRGFQRSRAATSTWRALGRQRDVRESTDRGAGVHLDFEAPCPSQANPIRARFGRDRDPVAVYGPAFPGSTTYWDAKFVDSGERGYLGATDLYDSKGRRWLEPKAPPARPAWKNPHRCRKNPCPVCLVAAAAGVYGALRGSRKK